MVAGVTAAHTVRADDGGVAARVNGVPIAVTEVQNLAARMSSVEDEAPEAIYQEALQSLIDTEILTQQAKIEKVEATDAEVDQRLAALKEKYPSAEEFQQALASHHAAESDLRNDLKVTLLIQKVLANHVAVKLDADAAEQFYKANPDKFQHPEQVHASHILFLVPPDSDETPIKRRAVATLGRIRKGEDLGKLAKELSDDAGTKEKGGDLGFFSRDDVKKSFADAAFKLKPGKLSGLVRTEYGFHIIKVFERRPAGTAPFADVKSEIENYLEEEEREKQSHAYVEGLKQQAKIEILAPPSHDPTVNAPTPDAPAFPPAEPSPPATPNQ